SECTEPIKEISTVRRERRCLNCGKDDHIETACDKETNPGNKHIMTYTEKGTFFDMFYEKKVELSHSSGKILRNIGKVESFNELGISEILSANITKAGYTKPSAIQKYAMKSIQKGKDLMACSQTGSGKTAAFLIPVINNLMQDCDLSTVSEGICFPRALILAPTRELAMQIHKEAVKFSSGSSIKCEMLYGRTYVNSEGACIREGATIIVGTAGRIKHF
ncbi:hypothetical protein PMAYCL1PPCAC_25441, partial [Pristionchus mayeri]